MTYGAGLNLNLADEGSGLEGSGCVCMHEYAHTNYMDMLAFRKGELLLGL